METKKKIGMVVGKSGGHIYPALAVAESLKDLNPHVEIHFVHSGGSMARNIFSKFQYPVYEIPLGGLAQGQSFGARIKTLFQLPLAFLKSFFWIRKNNFTSVFGTGGSITGPVLLAGLLNRCSVFAWEGNSTSGLANRYLSFFIPFIFTVFPDVKGLPKKKQILCGYPLRDSLIKHQNFNPQKSEKDLFKIFIVGGSQGSLLLNQVLARAVQDEKWREDLFIYHQTGQKFYSQIEKIYKDLNGVQALGFISDISKYYQEADLIVARAGSGTIFEVASFKKPLVLIPLSHSAGGHQLQNALKLEAQKQVEMIKESDFNVESFKNIVLSLKSNRSKREAMASSLFNNFKTKGAKTIAQWLEGQRFK